jgi:L-ascorbate metabolism protein UlaG (beta-lactamase superfamily)
VAPAGMGERILAQMRLVTVPAGSVALWFLGQSSVAVKTPHGIVYIDPYFSDYVERVTRRQGSPIARRYPSPLDPAEVSNASLVLITHDHEDHLDLDTLPLLAKASPQAYFVLPGRSARMLADAGVASGRMLVPPPWERVDPVAGIAVTALPAAHEAVEDEPGLGHRFFSYVLDAEGVRIFHSGDTLVHRGLAEWLQTHHVDLGLVAINGRDYFRAQKGIVGNMTYREAADLAALAGFEVTIPLHYDLFEVNGEDPGLFVDYLVRRYPERSVLVLGRGAHIVYTRATA